MLNGTYYGPNVSPGWGGTLPLLTAIPIVFGMIIIGFYAIAPFWYVSKIVDLENKIKALEEQVKGVRN